MAKDVRAAFLDFARSGEAKWNANFRDLNAAVTRMATLAPGGRITHEVLGGELGRLRTGWKTSAAGVTGENGDETTLLAGALGAERAAALDLFDRAQLACVIRVCRDSKTLSEAGRRLFAVTRGKRKIANDADRLRKYLARFGLAWPCGDDASS